MRARGEMKDFKRAAEWGKKTGIVDSSSMQIPSKRVIECHLTPLFELANIGLKTH
jgi:hypothetical protein